jgi:hypothetical protein
MAERLAAKSSDDGTALLRVREAGNTNELILSVMFKGACLCMVQSALPAYLCCPCLQAKALIT